MSKIKTAVIIYGLVPRSIQHTKSGINQHIIRPLQKRGEVKVFYHSWEADLVAHNQRTGEEEQVVGGNVDMLKDLECSVEGVSEPQSEFDESVNWELVMSKPSAFGGGGVWQETKLQTSMNFLRALESQRRAFSQLESSGYSPDMVVVIRPDVLFLNDLKVDAFQSGKLYVPEFHPCLGYNDRFALGDMQTISKYCNRGTEGSDWVLHRYQNYFNTETFLKHVMDEAGIEVNYISILFQRVRADGSIASKDSGIVSGSVVLYSCIVGDFDSIDTFINNSKIQKLENVQYVLYTDMVDDITMRGGWELRPLVWKDSPVLRRIARWHKMNSHLLFPQTKYSIWIDGTQLVKPNIDVYDLLAPLFKEGMVHHIATFKHPERDCIFWEWVACDQIGKDDPEVMNAQMERYRKEGTPSRNGLVESSCLIRYHSPEVENFNNLWWEEIKKGSLRDQLSFNYVIWKLGMSYGILNGCRAESQYFTHIPH